MEVSWFDNSRKIHAELSLSRIHQGQDQSCIECVVPFSLVYLSIKKLHRGCQGGGIPDVLGWVPGLFLPSPSHYPRYLMCRSGEERLVRTLHLQRERNQCSLSKGTELLVHKASSSSLRSRGGSLWRKTDTWNKNQSFLQVARAQGKWRIRRMSAAMLVPRSTQIFSFASCY